MPPAVIVRPASPADLADMLDLAVAARERYAGYQPVFWRPAADARDRHRPYLLGLLRDADAITLVAVADGTVVGFAVGTLVPAPPVYDPGGPTCMVDDFVVADAACWPTAGLELLRAVRAAARLQGAAQVVVVAGQQDAAKRAALRAAGLSIASEWWVGGLDA